MTTNNQETGQTPFAVQLRTLIAEGGPLSFADYMQLCLYHPEHGYYMQPRQRIGKAGDFFTSSSVHSLFGRLIARQLVQMAGLLGEASFRVVEQGPGEGHLALDILDALADEAPQLYQRLDYLLIERSPERQRHQQQLLARHRPRLSWCAGDDWTLDCGCLLSNELVDAFPVHLVEKRLGELQEVFVTNAAEGSGLVEELRPASPAVRRHFDWLGLEPAEGNRAEANLAAPAWMRSVGERLGRGFVLTIDYGYPAQELYAPHRRLGTLMCYRQHQADDNPYQLPGEKDITAHVDFTALQQAGAEAGLETLWLGEQYRFLLGLGFFEELLRLEAAARDEQQARAVRMTLKNLIMPDAGMGETFKVLVQGKGVGRPQLLCARPVSAIPLP
ncbi:MAG: SAM-dependent methyltransferase [Desulfuromonadales bacterium]|nr:SAM-dependent methyltransferase [Desulfuromonadales bacterium]